MDLPRVWTTGTTLEECMENLKKTLESWLLVNIKNNMTIPKLGKYEIIESVENK
ncbi:MAG: type II toxin-antitoxin system HicB family antitoxin [Bacillota bacterium]